MIERCADMWKVYEKEAGRSIFCITTNGFVKRNGRAIMGRGVAKQAALRFPKLPTKLGQLLQQTGVGSFGPMGPPAGNHVQLIGHYLAAFPVKPATVVSNGYNVVSHMRKRFPLGAINVPGWAAKADLGIITRSLEELEWLYEHSGWNKVFLPRPGCGAGELSWERVRPLCEKYGDWLVVLHYAGGT